VVKKAVYGVFKSTRLEEKKHMYLRKLIGQNIFRVSKYATQVLHEQLLKTSTRREIAIIVLAGLIFAYAPNIYSFALLVVSLVLSGLERLNSAINNIRNHITPDFHPAIYKNKDLAAATIMTISVLLAIATTLFFIIYFALSDTIVESIANVKTILVNNKGEYLFYFGSSFISLLLLQKRKWIHATLVFLMGVAWLVFYQPIDGFVNCLGADSFSETKNFDMEEAKFWITTLSVSIHPTFNSGTFVLYTLIAIACFFLLKLILGRIKFTSENYYYIKISLSVLIMGAAIHQTVSDSISLYFKNSEQCSRLKQKFSIPPPRIEFDDKKINLLVYIGESTSVANMGIYGYSRNTTPRLEELKHTDSNLLIFNNVYSTHTHTSMSLLEAFSFAVDEDENFLPIGLRKRISIVDLLYKSGIKTSIISNQGMTGDWNQTPIIFNNAHQIFSTKSRLLGKQDYKQLRPWDHDFFYEQLGKSYPQTVGNKGLVFFHSYAGHGGYLNNIPESYRQPVDNSFIKKKAELLAGKDLNLSKGVEEYDSAIKYIDFTISKSIEVVKNLKEPTIFIYFSDHGEAVFAGLGHDSSRFLLEMANVPLLIYFNDAARETNTALYEKYRRLAKERQASTLAQLPSTFLDLLGIRIISKAALELIQTPVIGEKTLHPPIIVRETQGNVITYVNINKRPLNPPKKFSQVFVEKRVKLTP
jgi:glucan phosphoethanolaminetransferase (alkaline phosphatase superfamily)